jgi:hypothetical protein
VVVNPSGVHAAPYYRDQLCIGGVNPVATVVRSCKGPNVSMVVVDGVVAPKHRKLLGHDEEKIMANARSAIMGMRTRSNAQPLKSPWKYI